MTDGDFKAARPEMDESRLLAIIDAFGGRTALWPALERDAACQILATSPKAQAARQRALQLDELLDTAGFEPSTGALTARILASVRADRLSLGARIAQFLGFSGRGSRAAFKPLGIMLASTALGALLGITALEHETGISTSGRSVEVSMASAVDQIGEDSE